MRTFLVVKRLFDMDDEPVKETEPVLRITDVSLGTKPKQIKDVLDRLGYDYEWGLHTVITEEAWPTGAKLDIEEFTAILGAADQVSYEDLLDSLNDEKRVTLRLPKGLHTLTSKEAAKKGISVNQYCINVLADAVNYTTFSGLPEAEK